MPIVLKYPYLLGNPIYNAPDMLPYSPSPPSLPTLHTPLHYSISAKDAVQARGPTAWYPPTSCFVFCFDANKDNITNSQLSARSCQALYMQKPHSPAQMDIVLPVLLMRKLRLREARALIGSVFHNFMFC